MRPKTKHSPHSGAICSDRTPRLKIIIKKNSSTRCKGKSGNPGGSDPIRMTHPPNRSPKSATSLVPIKKNERTKAVSRKNNIEKKIRTVREREREFFFYLAGGPGR